MTSTIRSRTIIPLAGIALILATAACGSDDPPPPSAPEPDLELTMTDPPPTAAADDPELEAAGGDYCERLDSFGDDVLGGATSTDPAAAAGLVDTYRDIAAVAPDDVAADWTALADAMEAMSGIDYSDPEALEDLEGMEDLGAVSQRLGESIQAECG